MSKLVYDLIVDGKTVGTFQTEREAKSAAAPYARCEVWRYSPDTREDVDVGTRVYAKLG